MIYKINVFGKEPFDVEAEGFQLGHAGTVVFFKMVEDDNSLGPHAVNTHYYTGVDSVSIVENV